MGKRDPKPKFTDITCPNEDYKNYSKVNSGNIVGNGTYIDKKMGKVHKFHCKTCEKSFTSNSNTILHIFKN
ncbi:MAG: hypothetical protein LBR15_04915 [Methanobrevibacter sp.]|jgi:hypothetical protein|nr:hypothetical protein [Candidatus Methanovirga australis]